MQFECPLPAALTAVSDPTCAFRLDQIVRILFQRRQSTAPFASDVAMQTLSNWTTLVAAVAGTKVVPSPIFTGFTIPTSEPITQGGNDNTTFAGIADYYGEGSVTAAGRYKNLEPALKVQLLKLTQESLSSAVGVTNLTAYFVNKDGVIFYTGADHKGIPIYNHRMGGRGSDGLNTPDIVPFSFSLPEGWDNELKSIVPTFDPLTEL